MVYLKMGGIGKSDRHPGSKVVSGPSFIRSVDRISGGQAVSAKKSLENARTDRGGEMHQSAGLRCAASTRGPTGICLVLFVTLMAGSLGALACAGEALAQATAPKADNTGTIVAYPIPLFWNVGFGKGGACVRDENAKSGWKRAFVQIFTIPERHDTVLKVMAPRNGIGSGQILLKSTQGTRETRVTVSDLQGGGGASLSSDNIRVRYGQWAYGNSKYRPLSVFEWKQAIGLDAEQTKKNEPVDLATLDLSKSGLWTVDPLLPEKTCKIHQKLPRTCWLTVSVGKDVAPGVYKGAVKVAGGPDVPLELTVVDAVLPDREQSPMVNNPNFRWEIIARGNGIPVEEWWKSERFWKMVEKYLAVLPGIRGRTCQVGVLAPSNPCSTQGMVKWIRDGEEWSWDFTNMERFIELQRKVAGDPAIVEASNIGGTASNGLTINFVDKATGKPGSVVLMGDDPRTWKVAVRFVKALKQSLARLKLEDKLCLGVWTDKDGIRMHLPNWRSPLLKSLIDNFPDLKISGWSHGNGIQIKHSNIGIVMGKINSTRRKYPYCLLGSMMYPRRMSGLTYKSVGIPATIWRNASYAKDGVGFITLAGWSQRQLRRGGLFKYKGHYSFSTELNIMVYPLYKGEVVTNVRYEVFRESCQDFELIKMMRKKKVESPVLTEMRTWLKKNGEMYRRDHPTSHEWISGYDSKHCEILEAAGKARIR